MKALTQDRYGTADVLQLRVRQKLAAFVVKENTGELLKMNELVATTPIAAPVLGPIFPLPGGAAAVATFETGASDGRIVIST